MPSTILLRNLCALALAALLVGCGKKSAGTGDPVAPSENLPALAPISSRALAPAGNAPADGEPLFEKLTAEQTGVDFVHTWSPQSAY